MPDLLGLDIGGANLKAVHSSGATLSRSFPLWKNPAGLTDALRGLSAGLPPAHAWAVTMTGELCDCYPSKRDGVYAILDAVSAAARTVPVQVWLTEGRFADLDTVRTTPLLAAAANWLALATFVGRYVPTGPALLIDIGSTTTDIIPLLDGRPVPRGRTDPERLRSRELIYTGARRTPLCALLGDDGAAEFFATTLDAYLVLGEVAEDPSDLDTADGRPATRAYAHARLARMLCADLETSTADERRQLAEKIRARQLLLLQDALAAVARTLPAAPGAVVVSGSGEFLARALFSSISGPRVLSLTELLGPDVSTAACAHAVAVLAAEARHGP